MTTKQTAGAPKKEFAIDDFDFVDTATMDVIPPGTGNVIATITFAGPAHPKSVELSNAATRKRLFKEAQAAVSTRPLPDKRTPDSVRGENVANVVDRIVSWDGFKRRDGETTVDIPFTAEAATELLADPRKGWLFALCVEFIYRTDSFTPSSAAI